MPPKRTSRRRLGVKISFIVSILCITSILLITVLAIHNASSALHQEAFAKLKAVQTIKKNQLQSQFFKIFEDIKLASQNSEMINIIRKFIRYHDEMKLKDGRFDISSSHPDVTIQYEELYKQAHTLLRKYSEIHGYLDVLLLCQKHGHIMYSSARGREFATSLRTGTYRDSHLSTLWKKARLVKHPVLTDIEAYVPSQAEIAAAIDTVTLQTGTGHILFIDDEPELVKVGRKYLEYIGYSVTTALSGTEALSIFRNDNDQFAAVITDQTMPGLPGNLLAQELLKIRPNIPVILCSGYSTVVSKQQAQETGIKAYLTKPVSIHNYAQTLHKIIKQDNT